MGDGWGGGGGGVVGGGGGGGGGGEGGGGVTWDNLSHFSLSHTTRLYSTQHPSVMSFSTNQLSAIIHKQPDV